MQEEDYEYGDGDAYVPGEDEGEEEYEWEEEEGDGEEEEAGEEEQEEAQPKKAKGCKGAKTKPIAIQGYEDDEEIDEYDGEDMENEEYDQEGDDRTWNNWSVTSFTPTGADTQWTPQSTMEVTEEVQSFPESAPKADEIVAGLEEGATYEDEEFPATEESLVGFGEKNADKVKNLEWKPLDELFESGYDIAGDKIGPTDVKQGILGDCYFICAIAAVAEFKERIRRNILTKDNPSSTVHSVALNICGIFEEVVIDGYIPYSAAYKAAAFTKSSQSQDVWVMLIEKAWAKVHGGYLNIESGYVYEALSALTGAPCYTYYVNDKTVEDNWKQMLDGEKRNYIMCCSSKNFNKSGNDSLDATSGLCPNHAYTVLSAHEVNAGGQVERLVKMRNPWGRGESKLAWNDSDPRWTPDLKKKLNHSAADDGTFFIRYSDWMTYFHNFNVCHYHDDFVLSSKKFLSSPTVATALTVSISTPGDYYFLASQINMRMFPKSANYVYSGLCMVVAKNEGDDYTYLASAAKPKEQVWVKVKLAAGDHTVYLHTPWRRGVNQFGFGVYGPASAGITLEDPSAYPEDFIQQMMIQKVKKNPTAIKHQKEAKYKYYIEMTVENLSIWYFANESDAHVLSNTVTFSKMDDLQLLGNHTGKEAVLKVQPGECGIILSMPTGPAASFTSSISSKWSQA